MATTGVFVDDVMKIFIDTVKFNHVTDFSIDIQKEMIGTTSFDSLGNKSFLPGDREWTASFTALVAQDATENLDESIADINGSSSNAFLASTEEAGDTTYGGTVYNSSVSITGSKGSAVQVAVSLQGTGAFATGTVV